MQSNKSLSSKSQLTMQYSILFISIFFSISSFSQCDQKILTGSFDTTVFSLRCPAYQYSFSPHNTTEVLNILDHNDINLVKSEYLTVEARIKDRVLSKTNAYFLAHLNFYTLEIVDLDRVEDFKYRVPTMDLTQCPAKYVVHYYFEPLENVKYCVGFALDDKMKIISTDNFPKGQIKPFQNTTVCALYDLGAKYLNLPTADLDLIVYKNKFYWSLVEKVNYKSGQNKQQKVIINAADLSDYIILDEVVSVDF
ncbi:hypothetical protein [Myroides fluvii]|uniref:hypothetical protein n=1 Tax=Myroides fluvii TaxID=2572594 RepID=UPI00131BB060|nr:hypothetical protein [Myroides fluvii]